MHITWDVGEGMSQNDMVNLRPKLRTHPLTALCIPVFDPGG